MMYDRQTDRQTRPNHTSNQGDSPSPPMPSGFGQVAVSCAESEAFYVAFLALCGSQALLRTQLGAPKPSKDPKLEVQGAPRTLTWRSQTFNFAHPYSTLATFLTIPFFPCKMLLDCFFGALGAFLGAFWGQLGCSWAPLGPMLGPLGRSFSPPGHLSGRLKRPGILFLGPMPPKS